MPGGFNRHGAARQVNMMRGGRRPLGRSGTLKTTVMGPRALAEEQQRISVLHERRRIARNQPGQCNSGKAFMDGDQNDGPTVNDPTGNVPEDGDDFFEDTPEQSAGSTSLDVQTDATPKNGSVGNVDEEEGIVEVMHNIIDMRRRDTRSYNERRKRMEENWRLGPRGHVAGASCTSASAQDQPPVRDQDSMPLDDFTYAPSSPLDDDAMDQDLPTLDNHIDSEMATAGPSALNRSAATSSASSPSLPEATATPTTCPTSQLQTTTTPACGASRDTTHDFTIQIVDIYTLETLKTIEFRPPATSGAGVLVQHGYIGASPIDPSVAFSIKTLKLFRRLRLRKASFSTEAFSKVLCDYYMRPYKRHYRTLLGDAFDVYLSILREVDKRVQAALGHDTPNWRVLNSCPACCYKLEGEPELPQGRMFAMDGNNSLKRVAKHGHRETTDRRVFAESDYYLSREFVDQYKDEVKTRKQQKDAARGRTPAARGRAPVARPADPVDEDDIDNLELGEPGEGDPTDGALDLLDFVKGCVRNWKSAAAEEKKKMWKLFDETGIFLSACRHGFILWMADMIKSRELTKYPLAVVAKILEVIKDKPCGAYDIGCSFHATILHSCLAGEFQRAEGTMIVNAFHGYFHNYACQMLYHPSRLTGMGLEDFETMERIFSASNALASVVRHMSSYRRGVFIDLFFQQWDRDKYENSALMLYNNYVQALDLIKEERKQMEETMALHNCTEADLAAWAQEEVNFVEALGVESPYDVHAMTYVELIQEWQHAKAEYTAVTEDILATMPVNYEYIPMAEMAKRKQEETSKTGRLEMKRHRLAAKVETADARACQMEEQMGIERRWTPDDAAYKEMLDYAADREYTRALDHLQKLVVQRLFELQKLQMSGTGYKMRAQLSKSLQSRCKALRNAVDRYNKAAPWIAMDIRAAIQQQRRINRAKEEIERCNVEIRRLHTHIVDEAIDMERKLAELRSSSSPLHGPVMDWWTYRRCINNELLLCIKRLYETGYYTGNPMPGCRIGRALRSDVENELLEDVELLDADLEVDDIEDDDQDNAEFDTMSTRHKMTLHAQRLEPIMRAISSLSLQPQQPQRSPPRTLSMAQSQRPNYALSSATATFNYLLAGSDGGLLANGVQPMNLPNSRRSTTVFPILVRYHTPVITEALDNLRPIIAVLDGHNATTIVTYIYRCAFSYFNHALFKKPWYTVAYTEPDKYPGIFETHADMSEQIYQVDSAQMRFCKGDNFFSALVFMVTRGDAVFHGDESELAAAQHNVTTTSYRIILSIGIDISIRRRWKSIHMLSTRI
ncbi:hypothetical protein NM688_g4924 [Phlebia brevispora]|uniref:Uncharacterized protein n=1 Tax=Phlebia brevispora TaxID=194682 RepID=A0ACC1T251_9APHY|nr:hypothetical protein NM688_g4924 [Phlebia brevispora]